jgi:hypothetical protein
MSDTLVVITEISGLRATKLLRRDANGVWLKEHYDDLYEHTWRLVPVADIRELHATLTELRTARSTIVIRGAPHEGIGRTVRRKLKLFGGTRGETPRQWVMLDFDDAHLADAEQMEQEGVAACLALDTLGGVDDEDRSICASRPGNHILDEFAMARRVDD